MNLRLGSGSEWEALVGYSRLVRIGNQIELAGTTAMENGVVHKPGDAEAQTRFVLEKMMLYLQEAGAEGKDVVRTRIYVTDIAQWTLIGKVHAEFFGTIKPVCTMVEVSRLIEPDLCVEIEMTAICAD